MNNSHPKSVEILNRNQHNISRKDISSNALKVLYRLSAENYEAYLVGGCVRDLLLGQKPKDFDIVTDATPEEIKKIFSNCRLIGKRFRLAHILFGREIIEVATFRGHHSGNSIKNISKKSEKGMLIRDNIFGDINEDSERRDFTINSLYYDIKTFSIRSSEHGLSDLKNRVIKLIGDPYTRYKEDPVRMLRAIRFSVKLNMSVSNETASPIKELVTLLNEIPGARLFDECNKLFHNGNGYKTYLSLREYNIFQQLFPHINNFLTEDHSSLTEKMIELSLISTDQRIKNQKRINPAFLYSCFLWYPLQAKLKEIKDDKDCASLSSHEQLQVAINWIIDKQIETISIPKRFTNTIRDIWYLQNKFLNRTPKRSFRLLEQPKFRAAFDFLEIRGIIEGGETKNLAKWWDIFQQADESKASLMLQSLNHKKSKKGYKRKHKV